MDVLTTERVRAALKKATEALVAERNERGFWEGELSSSALSTATATAALAIALKHDAVSESQISGFESQINAGLKWLATHANSDGGWGDTTKSLSNISTTTLCWAAFGAASGDEEFSSSVRNAEHWLAARAGGITPEELASAIITRYGKDRTFSVPILTMCALAGRLGNGRDAWRHVIPLPFELAACPHQFFAALRLPVVSYALPALIAIGLVRHVHAPPSNPIVKLIRDSVREKTLRVLTKIQPGNGGFLEATPLTSFVTMSLAGSGQANHVVTQRGIDFLRKSQRADGSWPIDTNLSTWCTTLAVDALDPSAISNPQSTIDWLLNQQYKTEHPYTHAAPGGWAWTDLPGGVLDADDTAGALVALHKLLYARRDRGDEASTKGSEIDQSLLTAAVTRRDEILRAAESGIRWLLDLQNRDGGVPTFCRGWGALPFDRSSPDITAHALRAWTAWRHLLDASADRRMRTARHRALAYLQRTQRPDGSWIPLWFGNQYAASEENPIYGTARIVAALAQYDDSMEMVGRGAAFLVSNQNSDGSWSGARNGPRLVEETALAVEALAEGLTPTVQARPAVERGVHWLVSAIESGAWLEPSPIGFYFAKLWYFERLYPLIFTVGALNAVAHGSESVK